MNITTTRGRHREATTRPTWLLPALGALAAVVLLVVLSACADLNPKEPTPEPIADNEPATEPVETVEEPESEPEPEPTVSDEGVEYELDVTWEDNGLTFTIDGFGIMNRAALSEDDSFWLEDDTQMIIALTGSITNDTGYSVDFYPDQGTLVVGQDQHEFSFLSDLGGTIHDGVTQEGGIAFESTHDMDWFDDITEVRFVSDGAWDTESYDDLTDSIDLTIQLGN